MSKIVYCQGCEIDLYDFAMEDAPFCMKRCRRSYIKGMKVVMGELSIKIPQCVKVLVDNASK